MMYQPNVRIFIQQFKVIIGSIFLSFEAGQIFVLVFAIIKIFFEVLIDFESLLKKAAKGELKSYTWLRIYIIRNYIRIIITHILSAEFLF